LVDVLSRWIAYAEEELSEFDLEDCENEMLCRSCDSAGCINLLICDTLKALSEAGVTDQTSRKDSGAVNQ